MDFKDPELQDKPKEELLQYAETFEREISYTFVDEKRNVVACLGAVRDDKIKDVAAVWLIASPLVLSNRRGLVQMVRDQLRKAHQILGVSQIVTEAEKGNHVHNRWLRFIGFEYVNTVVSEGVERNIYRRVFHGN